ncbi:hypothetical protein [uncultured Anaerobiospirillum sp.]|uniref:hypothetical protein n=1 Tax=uncultured Anaerobiospirillum sp. TaxID=265728 RepID=UPI0028040834|nr:hypothetical protein [uncultured Anaerobiospirillum sp.]
MAKFLQLMKLIGHLLKIVIISARTRDINKATKHEQWLKSHDTPKKKAMSPRSKSKSEEYEAIYAQSIAADKH